MQSQCVSLLKPYRVLDLTDEKGLVCGKMLSDLGADVVRVERPGGDSSRTVGPFYIDNSGSKHSLFHLAYNAGKKGITLDIETRKGQEIFRSLVKTAHFVIESSPPGYMDRLGLGYPALSEVNPGVIMTSITPFGQSGPYRDYKGSDIVTAAMGGLMNIHGEQDRAPVTFPLEAIYGLIGGYAAAGSLIAHYYRQKTGEGQRIDVSMQECIVCSTYGPTVYWQAGGYVLKRMGQLMGRGKADRRIVWPCKNGYVSWAIYTGAFGRKTRALVDWLEEAGMAMGLEKVDWEGKGWEDVTQEECQSWDEVFRHFFASHTKEELYEEAVKRGFMLFPVDTVEEVLNDVQLKVRDFWVPVEDKALGVNYISPSLPFKSTENLTRGKTHAPLLGEHNEQIYGEELGFSNEDLRSLRQSHII